jgi:hypothetical protein
MALDDEGTPHIHEFTHAVTAGADGAIHSLCKCGARLWEPNVTPEDRLRAHIRSQGFSLEAANNLLRSISEAHLRVVAK